VRRARRALRSSEWKTRILGVVMNTATADPVFPPFELDGPLPDPHRPTVFVSLHVGAMPALGAFLRSLPLEVAALHRLEWRLPSTLVDVYVARNETARVVAFHRAVTALRGGGHVFIPMEGDAIRVPLLGGSLRMTRGPFALARLTGAPIVPLLARWDGGRARIHAGRPVAAARDEEGMALAVARQLERYLGAYPSEIDDWLVTGLIDGHPPLPDL
jgi:lauroyl/myristoyl acyltransferase